jgi:3-methyladenine DNA glycosylase AlkD
MSRPRSLRLLAAGVNARLKALGNPRHADRGKSYFKPDEEIWLHGVRARDVHALELELFQEEGRSWSVEEAVDGCDALLHDKYLEAKIVGILLLARFKKHFPKKLFSEVEGWLAGDLCNNWASADTLSISIVAPLLARYPELTSELGRWARAKNLWLRRSAAVGLVPLARRGERLNAAYAVAQALLSDREDLIHKAVGWLLRESGKKDPRRLQHFLLVHGPQVPRTAVRYAIEKFPGATRKKLLIGTR